jgi:hypothetical protein
MWQTLHHRCCGGCNTPDLATPLSLSQALRA